jgi:uracil-DNA glycosylase
MSQVNLKDVQQKLYEKLQASGWDRILRGFVLSEEFYNILDRLLTESNLGDKFTPVIKDLFRAFEECPYTDLKVVLVGQDPYPKVDVADGIAFSCSKSDVQASLKYIYTGMRDEGIEPSPDKDLSHLSRQGILMLNTALTTQVKKIGSHVELWKPFTNYLLDTLSANNTGLVYIFMGKKAQEFFYLIDDDLNYKLECSHPASAAYSGQRIWKSNGVFTETNRLIEKNYNTKIIW